METATKTKFHINENGEAQPCSAIVRGCPFGSDDQHFNSAEEAREAYEAQMVEFEKYKSSPLGKLDLAAGKAVDKLKKGLQNTVNWLDDHPKFVIGAGVVAGLVVGVLIAKRVIDGMPKGPTSVPVEGEVVDSSYIISYRGKNIFVRDYTYTVEMPNGEQIVMTNQGPIEKPIGSPIELHEYSDGTIHNNAAPSDLERDLSVGVSIAGASGGIGGVSGLLASMGITRMADYLYSKWNLRNEQRFGLVNWRAWDHGRVTT